jgi:hypothetical protein
MGAWVFTVDHPGLPECAGTHQPGRPCNGSRGKHPCGRWSRDSTASPAVIRAALAAGLRNLGIDMGRSGLFAVDEDRPGAFAEYAASLGEDIPVTFTVHTSKGRHLYFRQPAGEPLGNGRGDLKGRGIDIRGAGGFLVGPGSVHETGVVYTPDNASVPVAAPPLWLVAALRTAPRTEPARAPAEPPCDGLLYARLRGIVGAVVNAKEGERNETLFWGSCRMRELIREGLIGESAGVGMLTQAGEATGLGPAEVAETIANSEGRVSA